MSDFSIPDDQWGRCSFYQDLSLTVFLEVSSLPIRSITRGHCFFLHKVSYVHPPIPFTYTSFPVVLDLTGAWPTTAGGSGKHRLPARSTGSQSCPHYSEIPTSVLLLGVSNGEERETDCLIVFGFLLILKTYDEVGLAHPITIVK